jgi:hypothetical protein
MVWRVAIAWVLMLWSRCVMAQEAPNFGIADFQGHWVVTHIAGYGDVSGGAREANSLLGKALDIRDDGIRFDNEDCKPTQGFQVRRVGLAAALRDYYGASGLSLALPKSSFMLGSANCSPVFEIDRRSVLFGWDGVMLKAERKGAGKE